MARCGVFALILYIMTAAKGQTNTSCYIEARSKELVVEGCEPRDILYRAVVCPSFSVAAKELHVNVSALNYWLCSESNAESISTTLHCYDGFQDHIHTVHTVAAANYSCPEIAINYDEQSRWQLAMYKYLQPIVVVVGVVGNVLSFAVMSSQYMRQFSFALYLKALAVLDTCVLIQYWIQWASSIKSFADIIIPPKGYAYCLLFPYYARVCQLSSAWLVGAFSLDRSLAICRPFLWTRHITVFRTRIIVGGLILVACLTQLYHPILLSSDAKNCEAFSFPPSITDIGAMEVMVVFSRFGLLFLLPFIAIVVSNGSVVVVLSRRMRVTSTELGLPTPSADDGCCSAKEKERRVSRKLFSISIAFLVLFLPDTVMMIMDLNNIIHGDTQWYTRKRDVRSVFTLLFSLNFAINYFLYGVAFRKHVILCPKLCRKGRRRKSQIGSIDTAVTSVH